MKLLFNFALAITALLLLSFAPQTNPVFTVEILQDNKIIPIENHIATLEKKQFQIRITLNNHDGIYFHSSFNRNLFNLQDNQEIKDLQTISNFTRVEENFNTDRDMEIDDGSISYLFYDSTMNWHRFDKDVKVNGNTIVGTKTIEKIYIGSNKKTIPINKIGRSIYLFFFATNKQSGGSVETKELGRYRVELRWK